MAELLRQIDAIDTELVALPAARSRYIDRAVALKRIEHLPARTMAREARHLDRGFRRV